MKKLCIVLILIWPVLAFTQNRYDSSASAPIVNTYIPMSPTEMYLRAATKVLHENQMKAKFEEYSQYAYNELRRDRITFFISYALAALDCGYYNDNLYYNIGVAYSIMGERRKSKKYLRKAIKKGNPRASYALKIVKEKKQLSKIWFVF